MVKIFGSGVQVQKFLCTFSPFKSLLVSLLTSCETVRLLDHMVTARCGDHLLVVDVVKATQPLFLLKGGLSLFARYRASARPTQDLDLAAEHLPNIPEGVTQALTRILAVPYVDGLTFGAVSTFRTCWSQKPSG